MRIVIMRKLRYNNVEIMDKRSGCGHDIEMVIICMYFDDLMFKMKFVGHIPRLYDSSYAEVI